MGLEVLHQKLLNERWDTAKEWLSTARGQTDSEEWYDNELPIHIALRKKAASVELIQALINAYPQGLASKGKNGMLPLHVASSNEASSEVIDLIIRSYPEALELVDDNYQTPRDYARVNNDTQSWLLRPTICWKTQLHRDIALDKSEKSITNLEAMVERIEAILKKRRTEYERVNKHYNETLPKLTEQINKTSEELGCYLTNLHNLQNSVEAFVNDASKRLALVENAVVERSRINWDYKAQELRFQFESFETFQKIVSLLDKLKNDTQIAATAFEKAKIDERELLSLSFEADIVLADSKIEVHW